MHLYFNKEGKLTTIIPHGEIPRQGSTLNVYVLLDEDFFCDKGENYLDWTANIELSFPNGKLSVPFIPEGEPQLIVFRKTIDSEITYDLVDKRTYLTYKFKFSPEQATEIPGKIEALVSIIKTQNTEGTASTVFEIGKKYFGRAEIYIERTFGYAQKFIDKSTEHYKNIMLSINNLYARKVDKTALQEELDKIKGVNEEDVIEIVKENSEVVNEIDVGLSENFDENSDKQIPTSKAVSLFVKNNSTNTQGMINITYDELKALRDNAQLIPGQQYRITDYETTTVQLNTRSAGHQFDIIVTADSEIALNENARACPHDEDKYFGGGLKTVRKYTGNFIAGLTPEDIVVSYTITIDREGTYEGELKGGTDKIVELSYKDGTPVFYKNDVEYIESGEEGTDYQDEFIYNGQVEYEGQIYDSWNKIEDGLDVGVVVYTNIVVENIAFTEEKKVIPPAANLAAWEIKYCLDNDSGRFSWSSDYESIYIEDIETWFHNCGQMEVRGKQYAAWKSPFWWTNRLDDTFILTETNLSNLKSGSPVSSIVFNYYDDNLVDGIEEFIENISFLTIVKRGKGVIYYMKDEHNNECSYDFKNIQFLRRAKDFNDFVCIRKGYSDFPEKKFQYFNSMNSIYKDRLKYGLEYMWIDGEELVNEYFDGDLQGNTGYLNKEYICLDDPEWNNDVYYLIRVSDFDYIWFYTFSEKSSSGLTVDVTLKTSHSIKNNIIKNQNKMLPNNIVYSTYASRNKFIDCLDMSFYSANDLELFNSYSDAFVGSSVAHIKGKYMNNNVFSNLIRNIIVYEYLSESILDSTEYIKIGSGKNNLFINCNNIKIENECNENDFRSLSFSKIGGKDSLLILAGSNILIGNETTSITVTGHFNVIGNECNEIIIRGDHNTLGNLNRNIHIGGHYNTIGNICKFIYLGKERTDGNSDNTIQNNCENIKVQYSSDSVYNCVFESNVRDINISNSISYCYIHGGNYFIDIDSSNGDIIKNYIIYPNLNTGNKRKIILLEGEREYITVVKPANQGELIIDEGE